MQNSHIPIPRLSKDGDTEDTMNMILLETETKESMPDVKLLKFQRNTAMTIFQKSKLMFL